MTAPQVIAAGKTVALGRLIGKGGEGEVYAITGDPNHAVKLYTTPDRLSRKDKVSAMVKSDLATRAPLAAFPVSVIQFKDGSFAGFVMRLMSGFRPVHELYAPGSRKQHFPQADYRFLARAATNIARAFASIHATNCVVGDINHSGILVSEKATAALIDADSFQFSDGSAQYLCRVGVPEYTPPELQGKALRGIVRTTDHDAFGLAVVIFQVLLMGRHPFVGTVRNGDIPPLHENVRNFKYVYTESRNVGMDQPPGTPSLPDFSPELARMFDRAFLQSSIGRRPSANEWVTSLERFESTLAQCAENPLHYGPRDASECAWCEMEGQLGTFLFVPHFPSGPGTRQVDPGRERFDIEIIWARIERVKIPSPEELQPRIPQSATHGPSEAAIQAKEVKFKGRSVIGVALIVAGFGLVLAAPEAWLLSLILAGIGLSNLGSKGATPAIDGTRFLRELLDAQNQWNREIEAWRRRVGHSDLVSLKDELRVARQKFIAARDEEHRKISDYKTERYDRQRSAYLENFDIDRAGIKGIGQAKIAVLSSFGIGTAADISSSRLKAVPGFGDALIGRLVAWRQAHESRFVYDASSNDADRREMARISSLVEAKLSPLRRTLTSGAHELEQRARRVQEFAQREDPVLISVHRRLMQARADVGFLNIRVPNSAPLGSVSMPSPRASQPGLPQAPQSSRSPTQGQSPRVAPSCPRCGSPMRQRMARRGRNAGSYFWGCSRYPRCKGTRSA
ncbi:topoisomerase DNA-binding C4 zinc finger domain-containing protein [Burkholderiaceae bacterium FT117]|uniref:helix-hairpin-helix domain-containing protein n=1 Tax=Zeimonas sediminis TaxID=2944268 RepID=UPI0023431EE9|nr:topoisomerase DNA-binding C4 zinc finger domain-containing protein [Zeimonas sediminis]MCM5570051.1 topoisomerase DNA-binding C4 zinc finger domain-containing protein [Zeimonas sediminis]